MATEKNKSVNNGIYDLYGDRWYTAFDDPIALLRAESKTKLVWLLEKLAQNHVHRGASILDVGCGAGFLTNALAREGYHVSGLDASAESLKVARAHDSTKSVRYSEGDAYALPFADETFEIVAAMDFLEHVDDPRRAVAEMARVLKPGGMFFYHTFNRNILSHLVVIKFVEWFVRNTPKDMHVIELFIKPRELANFCTASGLRTQEVVGLRPVMSSVPLKNLFSGIVPESMKFKIVKSTLLSYLGYAVKD